MTHNQATYSVFDGRSVGFFGTAYRVTFASGEAHDTDSLVVARAAAAYANSHKCSPSLAMVVGLSKEVVSW